MNIRQLVFIVSSFCALVMLASGQAEGALIFGTNLIQNAGAEQGMGAATNNILEPVPSWTRTAGNFTVVQYSTIPMSVPRTTDPGPLNRGTNLFSGGSNNTPDLPDFISSGDQIQDVSNAAASIDTGLVPFALSAYLGGYFDQRDNATFTATFENGLSMSIGSVTVGPVTLADRFDASAGHSVTELLLRNTNGFIPVGTRQIDFQLLMNGIDGNQNDGYADNLSFIATNPNAPAVPEPGSMGMLAVGLAGLGGLLLPKRRKGVRR